MPIRFPRSPSDGVRVELIERGAGRPMLFLHPGIGIEPTAPVLDRAGARARASSRRRIRASAAPSCRRAFDTVDDLAYFYLDLLEQLDLRDVVVVGVSLGGWIAAEIAVKSTARLSHLVLANAVGIKVGDRETRDIVDIWSPMPETSSTRSPISIRPPASATTRRCRSDELLAAARNREATARFAWSPYMHNPKLKGRLHRIRMPTLFLWGAADRILSASAYGRAYCAAIPARRFEPIERAGHFPAPRAAAGIRRRGVRLRRRQVITSCRRACTARASGLDLSSPIGRWVAVRVTAIEELYPRSPQPSPRGERERHSRSDLSRKRTAETLRHAGLSLHRAALSRAWNDHQGSLRVNLPNRKMRSRRSPADLFHRYYDEWLIADELGYNIMLNEHHQTATCMSSTVIVGLSVLARADQDARGSWCSAIRSATGPIRCAAPRSSPPST